MAGCVSSGYTLVPHKLGMVVRGIHLAQGDVPRHVVEQIKSDVTKHRLLIFKDQGIISGQKQVDITRWFGEPESTFYNHPKSPHPDVFRVSNDPAEGCTGVGRTGWHIDGSFMHAPFAYSIYHIVRVPKRGATVFAPLTDLIERLEPEKRARWERLWMVSDRRNRVTHPLIYPHPATGLPTLCFHVGMTEEFVWDAEDASRARATEAEETGALLREIEHEFTRDGGSIQYEHEWEEGDFIISDNLALGHEAHPSTQAPPSAVGLRVMHRTTVCGASTPSKRRRGATADAASASG
ncbi:3-((Z)-2-isocyanoethenyl)-1H-indole synthase-like isoform X1 [Petromyzon marinus]|uniref:Alpha-ketoglutarate-dependent taurine dioxygenase-like isoform X1 n=1 Tax=Petromyzon marinus TaxID=7757 RepID=A0AAJ7SVA1_PETMA|nr:alpha-ketoglutarate-dependent taurine dioxygenase-like isoform X1 [Petromyzon marinus]XP_032805440.1 alpha-ketoglutarate-dependent taurine dioxygenase-like isoform X1 [Petromyzon marinus]XP_032805441.1 alpha-ketoglutarate-dependent taurine dioxygenase-like isoform X1 [Petromyzon marinus]XP_032805443.1 alpha-ketoglutarate-dependent taurine dioxygenase-like isoform X1 [Petromyzon marinus]